LYAKVTNAGRLSTQGKIDVVGRYNLPHIASHSRRMQSMDCHAFVPRCDKLINAIPTTEILDGFLHEVMVVQPLLRNILREPEP
jgi:hypothetical protein